jgi:hypothetical protein
MNPDFDFDKVGKRMPYKVPDDFFSKMEKDIWEEISVKMPEKRTDEQAIVVRHKFSYRRFTLRALTALAAAVALFFVINTFITKDHTNGADIEQAFGNLSQDDQAYLLEVYQEDIFLNQ